MCASGTIFTKQAPQEGAPFGLIGSVELGHSFKEYSQIENAQIKHLLSVASQSTPIPPLDQAGSDKIKSLQTGVICSCGLKSQIMQIKSAKATAAPGSGNSAGSHS